jgi:hypothetical protein
MSIIRVIVLSLIAVATCQAEVWNVEADGSGDVPTIQAAVDAASPGDIIELGSGVFTAFQTEGPVDLYVHVTTDDLTFRGRGRDQSIIGPTANALHDRPCDVMKIDDGLSVRLENLSLCLRDRSDSYLLRHSSGRFVAVGCAFREAQIGVHLWRSEALDIDDCDFSDCVEESLFAWVTGVGVVRNCRFTGLPIGFHSSTTGQLSIAECYFDGSDGGGNSVGLGAGNLGHTEIRACSFVNHTRAALLLDSAETVLDDCEIRETSGNGLEFWRTDGILTGSGNVIASDACVLVCHVPAVTNQFRRNHFLAGGSGLLARVTRRDGELATIDLAGNWWGTDDIVQIQARIDDYSATDPDPGPTLDVLFLPILDGPVATQRAAWGALKSLFR